MKKTISFLAVTSFLSCGLATTLAQAQTAPVYPLKVSANKRYLVDQNNKPFLIVGDTPQGLIYRLTEKQADDYFADRSGAWL